MQWINSTAVAFALSLLVAGPAAAQSQKTQGKTRAQVNAELAEARRTGDVVLPGEYGDEFGIIGSTAGRKLNEIYPNRYPAKPVVAGKTRTQVRAELQAQRTGDIVVDPDYGDMFGIIGSTPGRKLNEIYPSRYPAKPVVAGKTRAQVRAELEEAQRTGDIAVDPDHGDMFGIFGSTSGRKLNEIYPNRYPTY